MPVTAIRIHVTTLYICVSLLQISVESYSTRGQRPYFKRRGISTGQGEVSALCGWDVRPITNVFVPPARYDFTNPSILGFVKSYLAELALRLDIWFLLSRIVYQVYFYYTNLQCLPSLQPTMSLDFLQCRITSSFFMVALCNRADHYIFILFLSSSSFFFFFSSLNLSGWRLDVYHTLAHGVALVRI